MSFGYETFEAQTVSKVYCIVQILNNKLWFHVISISTNYFDDKCLSNAFNLLSAA